jgi:hypothetical protein
MDADNANQVKTALPAGFVLDQPEPQAAPTPQTVSSGANVQLPPGFQLETPDLFGGATNEAAKWATFGLADPVAAAGRALIQPLLGEGTDTNFGGRYSRNLQQQRGEAANFAQEHPVANDVSAGLGALSAAAPAMGWPSALRTGADLAATKAPASIGGQMLVGGGVGAVQGATASDDPLRAALYGGIGGAVAAPVAAGLTKLASIPIDAFSRRFLNGADTQALDRIAGRISQDTAAGGPGIPEMKTALAGANGKPLSLADVGGENVQGLAGNVARQPGPGREATTGFLAGRNAGAGGRLVGDVDTALNPQGQNAFTTAADLMDQRARAATPLYDQARAANPVMWSPEIGQVLSTPNGKMALAAAQNKMKNDPALFGQIPAPTSLQSLDYVKRAFDDQIGGAIKAGNNDDARIFTSLKNQLTGAIDKADSTAVLDPQGNVVTPGIYKQARDAFAGPSALNAALEAGQQFRTMRPELIQQTVANMSPSEREFFRLGAADTMRTAVSQTGDARALIGSNAVNNRGADYMKQQLRPLFDSDAAFNSFVNNTANEQLMQANTTKLIGNSQTAPRLAEDQAPSSEKATALGHVAAGGASIAQGNPLAMAISVPRAVGAVRQLLGGNVDNPAVNAAVARRLQSGDLTANNDTLAALLSRMGRPALPAQLAVPAASYAGSNPLLPVRVGAGLASAISNFYPGEAAR